MVDHGDLRGQPVGLVEILRRQEHGRSIGDEPLDRLPELQTAARVETGRGLIEEEDGRLGDERGREIEPAAHAPGVGLGRPARRVEQFKALQQLMPAPLGLGTTLAIQASDHREVLKPGEVFVDRRILAGESDPLTQPCCVADNIKAGHLCGSGIGAQKRRQDADDRRLAGTVGTEQAKHRSRARPPDQLRRAPAPSRRT